MAAEMIERVAKEIFELVCPGIRYTGDDKAFYESRVAKAAIAAMREPTEGMIFAGSIDPGSGGVDTEYTKEVYRAMIDKALEE